MKVPDVVQNVYRDLRDRRMLSIAIALVAAIVAVPFLLGGGGGEDASPASSVAGGTAPFAGDEQLNPVVLAEVPGLRDFRQRLAAYRSHNPFKRQLTEEEKRALASGGGGGSGSGTGTGTGTGTDTVPTDPGTGTVPTDPGTGAVPTDTGTAPTGTGSTDTGSTGTGSTDPGGSGTGSTGTGGGAAGGGAELVSYRIDVRVGPVGHTKVQKDVEQLEFLPDRTEPLVQFIDANVTGTKVAFIVNPLAAAVKGDAQCVRSKQDCQYLVMEPKDEMYFTFEDRQYRIQLMSINEHRQPYEPQSGSSGGEDPAGRDLGSALDG